MARNVVKYILIFQRWTHLLALSLAKHLKWTISLIVMGTDVGETTHSLRNRWNNYKSNNRNFTRNWTSMQEHFSGHFNCEHYQSFLENISITLIDKRDHKVPLKRGDYWRRTLKTYALLHCIIECFVWVTFIHSVNFGILARQVPFLDADFRKRLWYYLMKNLFMSVFVYGSV